MSTILEQLEYGFDRDSRRTWRRRAFATGEDNAYGYDGLSQVVNAALGNLNLNATAIGGVPAEDEAWDYDPTGNWRGYRVEENGAVTLEQERVHDKGNRLMQIEGSAQPVLVDRAGRMTQVPPDAGGDWSDPLELVWDAWSRLVEVSQGGSVVGSYAYDGLNRRTTRTTGGATLHSYYSDAWRPLEERQDSQTKAAMQYYWGARHRDDLVRRDRATVSGGSLNETRYVLMDYFSPVAITDGSGNVTERYAFSAFGVRRIMAPDFSARSTSECAWDFAFQGQFLDSESGFLDYGYRYYSPFLGRWLSKDLIEEAGGLNLYAFAENNGVNAVDFLGLQQDFKCCDNKKIDEGEQSLKDKFDAIKNGSEYKDKNVATKSCQQQNSQFLYPRLDPIPLCWVCTVEHRYQDHTAFASPHDDHWVVTCKAYNKQSELVKERIFDLWGGVNDGPRDAFVKEYPIPGRTNPMPSQIPNHQSCDGTRYKPINPKVAPIK